MTEEERESAKVSSPFGKASNSSWFNLFTVNELFVAKGYENDRYWNTYNYEGSIGNALASDNVGSGRIDNKNGLAFVSTAAVDVNGSGKKDHVAVLAYNRAQERLELFLTDQYGTRIGSVKVFGYVEDGFDYMDAVSSHDYTGLVSLTAGDFDGDGKDTVVVYWPRMRADDNETGYMPAIFETEFSGSGFSLKRTITKNIYSLLGTERQNEIADSNSADGKVRDNCAVVDLVAADTDKDGLDELLITAGMNNCSANDIETRQSKLFIMDLTSNGWSTTHTLDTNGYQDGKASNPTRLRWASSSVGNLIPAGSGSDYDEILTAGWVDEDTDDDSSVQDRIGVYLTFCTGTTRKANGDTVGSYQSTGLPCLTEDDVSEFTRGGHYDDDCQSLVPVAVFNGDGVKESGADNAANVLIADTVYLYKDSKLSQVFRYDYFNDDDDGIGGTIITNGLVQSAVAGNFDGNTDGKEQVILTTCQKQSSVNNYFYKVYTYQKNGKGEWTCDASSYVVDKKSTAYLSLCPVDVDDDSTIVRLKDISRTYTDVEALAILESSPTFAEIEGGDVGNGATAYGKSKSSGTESSYSNSLTVNTVVGFEWEMDDVTLGFSLGAGFEATTDHAFTWETSDTTTLTYELNYANDTGDNLVIVYRRPVTCYRYEVKDSDAVMTVNRVGNLVTSMVTVDEYNALASRYEMDRIPDDLLGEAGKPHTYHNTTSGLTNVVVAPDTGHYAANGTTEMAFTTEQEHSDAFSYEMDVSFTAYGQVFGAKFGGGAGYTHSTGSATISSEGITKSGAVTGHIENGYDFNWQFMHWVTELNHCEVPVLGYLLSNVIAPPTPPVDLVATDVTANSARLTWEIGDRPAEEYRVYQIFPNGSVFRVATVDGTENACTLSDLEPGDTYEYVVRGYAVPVTADATGESVSSESVIFTTTPQDAEPVQITAPANMSAAVGATASTSVDVQVPASTKYKGIELQWQVRQGSGNWTDVPDATNSTLTLSGVTQADNGNEYRCKVTAYYGVTVLTYYSETATLQVGRTPVTPTLTVENALGGAGTEAEPYTGKADYNREENKQTEQTSVEPVTIDASGLYPALTVYGVAVTTDGTTVPNTAEGAKYYGQAENGAYYTVTKTGETYAAADAISVEETTSYHTVDGTDYTPPAGFTAAQMTKTDGDNVYALFAAVTGTQLGEKDTRLSTCTDTVYYWFSNGNYYAYGEGGAVGEQVTSELDGLYEVYQLAAGDAPLILGRGETWQEAGEDGGAVSGYWYDSVETDVTAFAET
ncbi:MAG: fibronectin type III domain-containing protein, partial [Oscillospiraceae bacterium]|nr:fibronectin type III domain-containing protein [Oscillospiraceae bacterium]